MAAPVLTPDLAGQFVDIALGHVARPYPFIQIRVVTGPDDLASPRDQHPVFHGSLDWHSCVHGHWLLAKLLRLYPEGPWANRVRDHFDAVFTAAKVAGELRYLDRPASAGFERPYGWAWLLMLASELGHHASPWAQRLRPLTDAIVSRFKAFLPKADYPVRAGVHSNTAFALALAHDYAIRSADADLVALIQQKARAWYGADTDCQAWEPSGDDFLSPSLMEAELMRRLMAPDEYRAWFAAFLPRISVGEPASLFASARVSDRGDGKIAHLDGVNLSRAWCWRGIASAFPSEDPVGLMAREAADRHLAASLRHVSGDYMGEHWLASFALLALLPPSG